MSFWDFVALAKKDSPFVGRIEALGGILNSHTPFSKHSLDLNWYEYSPCILDVEQAILLPYRNQASLAGIDGCGLHERVFFRVSKDGHVAPADCGNELFWRTSLAPPETDTCHHLTGKSVLQAAYGGLFFYSFGHFILENLPRLWMLGKNITNNQAQIYINLFAGERANANFKKIIHESPNYKPYLQALGILDIIEQVPSDGIHIGKCKVAPPTVSLTQTGLHISTACQPAWRDVNNQMSKYITQTVENNLYLTRSRTRLPYLGRTLINEAEVEGVFESLGFKILSSEALLEEYGVDEAERRKHAFLRDAKTIAGTAGSNLLNHVFCPQDCTVLLISNMFTVSHQRSGAVTHSIYFANYLGQNLLLYLENSVEPKWTCDLASLRNFVVQNI